MSRLTKIGEIAASIGYAEGNLNRIAAQVKPPIPPELKQAIDEHRTAVDSALDQLIEMIGNSPDES